MINDQGGINGRKINFISYDDGYTPPKTVEMVRKLVEEDEVLLVASPLGTPTNSAIWHYMNQKKVPQLFVATGATKWDDPKGHPWTIGWQPNYQSEGRIYATYILKNKPDGKIGVLYQNDDFGKDYLKGVKDGLGDKASMIMVEASYETTDPTVDSQVVDMKAKGVDVFVNTAIPKFAAQAIRKAAEIEWKPLHILSSIGNSVAATLKPAGLENAKDIVSDFYLKDPSDPQWKDDAGYKDWAGLHGQVSARRRQERRRQRCRLSPGRDDGTGAQAMRRRVDPRERHEAGGEHARFHRADAAAGDHGQHHPDRFRADQAGADGQVRRSALEAVRRPAEGRDRLSDSAPGPRYRGPGPPPRCILKWPSSPCQPVAGRLCRLCQGRGRRLMRRRAGWKSRRVAWSDWKTSASATAAMRRSCSDVSVTLDPGGFYFLTGVSGAGKTTLLKIIYLAETTLARRLQPVRHRCGDGGPGDAYRRCAGASASSSRISAWSSI